MLEGRNPGQRRGVWGACVSPPPSCTPGTASDDQKNEAPVTTAVTVSSAAASSRSPTAPGWIGTLRPTRTGPTNQVNRRDHASCRHGFPAGLRRRHHQTAVAHPRLRLCAYRLVSSRLLRLTQMPASRASKQWTAPYACGWAMSSSSTERTTAIGSTLGASNCPLRRAGLTHLWRTCTRIANRNLNTHFWSHIAIRHLHYALTKTTGGRLTNCSSCRGTLALQGGPTLERWLVTSTARGTSFVYRKGKVLSPVALWKRIST